MIKSILIRSNIKDKDNKKEICVLYKMKIHSHTCNALSSTL